MTKLLMTAPLLWTLAFQTPEESRLEARFRDEFAASITRNESFYSQLSGSCTYTTYVVAPPTEDQLTTSRKAMEQSRANPAYEPRLGDRAVKTNQIGGTVTESRSLTFALDGPLHRIVLPRATVRLRPERTPGRALKDDPPRPGDPVKVAQCQGRDAAFQVNWYDEGGPPVLADLEKGSDEARPGVIGRYVIAYLRVLYHPSLLGKHFFPSPSFLVKSVKPVVKDGVNLAHVEFEVQWSDEEKAKHQGQRIVSGWFEARPDQGWVIQELQLSTHIYKDYTKYKVEFDGVEDGLPLPKRITRFGAIGRATVEFDTLRHGPTPEREFTLTAFGLPEIHQTLTPPDPNRNAYWLVALGALAVLAAIGLKLASRRRPAG